MSTEIKSEPLTHDDYQVGWICALPLEAAAATALLDEEYPPLDQDPGDTNAYTLGRIGRHNVAIGCLPLGTIGESPATAVAKDMLRSFPNIKIGFMVGVGGGAPGPPSEDPQNDIRLGDIVVSNPGHGHGGVVQYDYGKTLSDGEFIETGYLNRPPNVLLTALAKLLSRNELEGSSVSRQLYDMRRKYPRKSQEWLYQGAENDQLYVENFRHADIQRSCKDIHCAESEDRLVLRKPRSSMEPVIHCGLIASGNQIMRDSVTREKLRKKHGVLCFEMEAAGLNNNFPCLVIRGICDYSDSHKNKRWQPYAAAVSAAFTKELLEIIPVAQLEKVERVPVITSKMEKEFGKLNENIQPLLEAQGREERQRVLNWLAPAYYQSQQADAQRDIDHSSGRIFMEHEDFRAWSEGSKDVEVLFCPGLPGAGKTTMASIVIDKLHKTQEDQHSAVAFLYINYNMRSEQTLAHMLRIILRQVVETLPSIPKEVTELHYTNRDPSLHEMFQLFSDVIGKYDSVFIIIDALDECLPETLGRLLDALQRLQSIGARFMLTYRLTNLIERGSRSFQNYSTLEIRAVDGDMETCITRLFDFSAFYKIPDESSEIDRFKQVIIKSAKGMFILLRLFINILKNKCTRKEIEEELDNIENDRTKRPIHEAYQKTSNMIDKAGHSEWAYRVISWVFHAQRPLSANELTEALAAQMQRNTTHLDLNYAPPDLGRIISYCAGLVILSPGTKKIGFVHFTAYQYFEENRHQHPWVDTSLKELSLACLKYLSFDPFANHSEYTSFLDYAVHFWAEHTKPVQTDREVRNTAKLFLQNQSLTEAADRMFPANDHTYVSYSLLLDDDQISGATGLHLVARFGLVTQLWDLLEERLAAGDVDNRDPYGQTPLILAVRYGHHDIVNIFLSSGKVDPNLTDDDGWSPLAIASQAGYADIARTLLSTGKTDPNLPASDGSSPVMCATRGNHKEVISLLLGVDTVNPNFVSPDGETALTLAVAMGFTDTVRLLLESGRVDTNPSDASHGNAFIVALENGNEEVIHLLLQHGYANAIETSTLSFSMAFYNRHSHLYHGDQPENDEILWLAVKKGLVNVVLLLLRKGQVNPNLRNSHHKSVLMMAVERGYKEVVEALVSVGSANPNAMTRDGDTALYITVRKRDVEITRILLEAGADPHQDAGDQYENPFHYALMKDYKDIFQIFLDTGKVDPNLGLLAAIRTKNTAAIRKFLVIPGVDLNILREKDDNGETALTVAVRAGDVELVRALLPMNMIDINGQNFDGKTALMLSVLTRDAEIVRLLVEDYGADKSIECNHGTTALSYYIGDDEIRRLLSPKKVRTG